MLFYFCSLKTLKDILYDLQILMYAIAKNIKSPLPNKPPGLNRSFTVHDFERPIK